MVRAENGSRISMYGATNPAFVSDTSPQNNQSFETPKANPTIPAEDIVQEKPEDERENWDSKLTFLLATIG